MHDGCCWLTCGFAPGFMDAPGAHEYPYGAQPASTASRMPISIVFVAVNGYAEMKVSGCVQARACLILLDRAEQERTCAGGKCWGTGGCDGAPA